MATPQEVKNTRNPGRMSADDLRARMCGIIEELVRARAERTTELKKEFDALWKQIPADPTVH